MKLFEQKRVHSLRDLEFGIVPLSLAWGGRIPDPMLVRLGALVNEAWVQPWTAALSRGEPVPDVALQTSSLGNAISEAAQLVQRELDKLISLHQRQQIV